MTAFLTSIVRQFIRKNKTYLYFFRLYRVSSYYIGNLNRRPYLQLGGRFPATRFGTSFKCVLATSSDCVATYLFGFSTQKRWRTLSSKENTRRQNCCLLPSISKIERT